MGAPGQKLFTVPVAVAGTARAITVNITDPNQVAASLNGTVVTTRMPCTCESAKSDHCQRPEADRFLFQHGCATRHRHQTASSQSDTQSIVLQQLLNQRNSISGVSMDEEAANLVRYQRAYQAAARVVNIIDEMTQNRD